jgi:protein-S-isoprenylcysteine O-methyltransferase Ste14
VIADVTLACWAVFELGVRVWEVAQGRGGGTHDRGSRVAIAVSLGVAIGVAAAVSSSERTGGAVVMWLGLAVRVWAVVTLGRAFRTTVEVDPGQAVVTRGPYRWVRHPSYLGLLLIVAGFGVAAGSWTALAVCVVVPLPALVYRIRVEEAELTRVLGEPYRAYRSRTARLIPGLW